ncbi:MAG: thioredoxin family protein [Candidatus Nanopelagicales bacterium]|nr:thioredoxin family protein [Candidatus Nanopelagicales bacterium]
MNRRVVVLSTTALIALAGCSSADSSETAASESPSAMEKSPSAMEKSPSAMEKTPEAMAGGAYVTETQFREDPSAYEDGNTVLFFHAGWCPDCQATDKSIQETGVPKDINIVKVDFDSANDLRKQYGITQQHTFVLIGPNGEEIKKWTGTFTADDINAQVS